MKFLQIILTVLMTFGCSHTVESTISESRSSVAKLERGNAICSSFHIGEGYFLTAAHCFKDGVATNYAVTDSAGGRHRVALIRRNIEKDMALFVAENWVGQSLQLWNPQLDGDLKLGSETLTLGFPGYYDTDFIFEWSRLQDKINLRGTRVLVVKEGAYKGQSGGPLLSVSTGKVIGLVRSGIETVMDLETGTHVHNSLGVFVSYEELRAFLAECGLVR